MSSITRNNFSIHSNSKGNLLKTEYQKDGIVYFVKSGRLQVRDFPEKWGIEPVIEVLCYEIGKLMGLNVAEQSLIGMEGIRYGKNFRTLVCSSPDFRNGKTLIYLASPSKYNGSVLFPSETIKKELGFGVSNSLLRSCNFARFFLNKSSVPILTPP